MFVQPKYFHSKNIFYVSLSWRHSSNFAKTIFDRFIKIIISDQPVESINNEWKCDRIVEHTNKYTNLHTSDPNDDKYRQQKERERKKCVRAVVSLANETNKTKRNKKKKKNENESVFVCKI